jgi:peptidoglycan LD-endopeptidase LytH
VFEVLKKSAEQPEARIIAGPSFKLAVLVLAVVGVSATAAHAWRSAPAPVPDISTVAAVSKPRIKTTTSSSKSPVFPVAGHERGDVVGRFGDPRDGGRRSHLGIDIAAPRGTAVVAVSDGTVERVEHTGMGGRVVWVQERGSARRHYFAHLETIAVSRGQRVRAGQTIGTVGTSGNAAGTAPHLHYAVRIGDAAIDPITLFRAGGASNATAEGRVMRTRLTGAAIKSRPSGGTIAVLNANQPVTVLGDAGRFYRVRYKGKEGYLARWLLE